ncbi:uncharacterized protein BCR38DRAFT_419140 [Pseudomassariella vexata]|uniref:Uncharacterized protein n=1 Tax=Pseudomassariella vexata TaxID=1141098 RepID=A0A1Y2EKW2_9PEZI|nr:uncharacterized protein BCR38DRAFT_419140 [Pseudomassariella vexata]ORY72169.1 hypothetical protein BCR38DRAFT_419140 [Pseudomassariella vexata]
MISAHSFICFRDHIDETITIEPGRPNGFSPVRLTVSFTAGILPAHLQTMAVCHGGALAVIRAKTFPQFLRDGAVIGLQFGGNHGVTILMDSFEKARIQRTVIIAVDGTGSSVDASNSDHISGSAKTVARPRLKIVCGPTFSNRRNLTSKIHTIYSRWERYIQAGIRSMWRLMWRTPCCIIHISLIRIPATQGWHWN